MLMEKIESFGNLIAEELAKAGTDPELIAKLKKDRITADKELPPMEFLLKLFDVPCCPRGELVAFTGKAKSGKTFVMSMMMAAASAAEALAFRRTTFEPLQVLWIDTEQSDQSTQDILRNRLIPMVCGDGGNAAVQTTPPAGTPPELGGDGGGLNKRTFRPPQTPPDSGGENITTFPESMYDIFNVRTESWQERMPLLLAAIDLCRPDLVILDGVRDLVDDINNGQLAHDVTERLMRVAQHARCCIVCVIHQNKAAEDRTLRGSIGTELTNKAFEVYECEKMMPSRTFVLTQKLTRKYDITDPLYFTVDDRGLPHQVGAPATGEVKSVVTVDSISRQTGLKAQYLIVRDDGSWEVNYQQLFRDALARRGELCGGELRDRVMGLCGMKSAFQYSELLEKAKADGILCMRKAGKRHYYWLAAPD